MLEPGTFNIYRQLHHVKDKQLNNKTVTMKTTNQFSLNNYKKVTQIHFSTYTHDVRNKMLIACKNT